MCRLRGCCCVYAQPVSDETKDPIGEPQEVLHSHDPRLSLGGVLNLGAIGLSVARDKIVVAMSENRGFILLLGMLLSRLVSRWLE